MLLRRYGVSGYGTYKAAHDNPTVTITAPAAGTISSGGPTITFSWAYSQAQGIAQGFYRVVLNDGTSDVYDSGYLVGSASSLTVDWNTAGLNPEHAYTATVWVSSVDGYEYTASATRAFTVAWGIPTVTITAPASGAVLTTSPITATWTYSDTRAGAETQYRVKLTSQDGLTNLYDTGWTVGSLLTLAIPFAPSDSSSYQLKVSARNPNGISSAEVSVLISTDFSSASTYPVLASVGTVYEVAINGVGYMLYDGRPDNADMVRKRITSPLEPQRLVTSSTPFAESLDHYSFFGVDDWRGGAGQRWAVRDQSDRTRFLDSDGINPFEPFQISLLPDTKQQVTTSQAPCLAVVASDHLYTLSGAKQLTYLADPDAATSNFSIAAAGTIAALASDGLYWYAGDTTTGIYRNNTNGDPGAAWSSVKPSVMDWAANRICVAYKGAGSTTPNVFSTVAPDGTEEIAGGRLILDKGWTITGFTQGGGWLWFSAYRGDRGVIYKWDMTSSSPSVAWELPFGERARGLIWSQGIVLARSDRQKAAGDTIATIWNCAVSSGNLVPSFLTQLDGPGDDGQGCFGAAGKLVFFSWPTIDGTTGTGLGAFSLASGGYSKWIKQSSVTNACRSILSWRGKLFFAVDGSGVWREDDKYVASGWVTSSIGDFASALWKIWDQIVLHTNPLPVNTSVTAAYTLNEGVSYTTLAPAQVSAGATGLTCLIGQKGQSLGMKLTLASTSTRVNTPVVTFAQVQGHAIGKADVILQLPIDCGENVRDLRGAPIPRSAPTGAEVAYQLEQLTQQRVQVQDVDWATTGRTEIFELVQVQRAPQPGALYDRQKGKETTREVVLCTLRRSLL